MPYRHMELVVRINVEPFDQPPDAIHETLVRMYDYYRS